MPAGGPGKCRERKQALAAPGRGSARRNGRATVRALIARSASDTTVRIRMLALPSMSWSGDLDAGGGACPTPWIKAKHRQIAEKCDEHEAYRLTGYDAGIVKHALDEN